MNKLMNSIEKAYKASNEIMEETKQAVQTLMADSRWSEAHKTELKQKLATEQKVKLDKVFEEFKNELTLPEAKPKAEIGDFAARTYYATVAANAVNGLDSNEMIKYFKGVLDGGNALLIQEAEQLLRNRLDGLDIQKLDRLKLEYMPAEERKEIGLRTAYGDVAGRISELSEAANAILQGYAQGQTPNTFKYSFGFKNTMYHGAKGTYERITGETVDPLPIG